jgi:hypothetical protein
MTRLFIFIFICSFFLFFFFFYFFYYFVSLTCVDLDNNDGTYTCTYPDITQDGAHVLEPKLNGQLIKHAPFHVAVEAGEVDLDNFEILWGDLAHPNATVVAGEEKKFSIKARVRS